MFKQRQVLFKNGNDRTPGFHSLHLKKLTKEKLVPPREGPREGQPAGLDQSGKHTLSREERAVAGSSLPSHQIWAADAVWAAQF